MRDANRDFSLDIDTAFMELVEQLKGHTLYAHMQRESSALNPPDHFDTLLHRGRKARNMIAHELTLGAADDIEADQGRELSCRPSWVRGRDSDGRA